MLFKQKKSNIIKMVKSEMPYNTTNKDAKLDLDQLIEEMIEEYKNKSLEEALIINEKSNLKKLKS